MVTQRTQLDGMVTRGRSAEAGVSCYLKKPVDMNVLGDCMRAVCEKQQELLKSRMKGEAGEN